MGCQPERHIGFECRGEGGGLEKGEPAGVAEEGGSCGDAGDAGVEGSGGGEVGLEEGHAESEGFGWEGEGEGFRGEGVEEAEDVLYGTFVNCGEELRSEVVGGESHDEEIIGDGGI